MRDKLDKVKKRIMKLIKQIKSLDYKGYMNTNILFLCTSISAIFNAWLLRVFTVGNVFEIKPFFGDVSLVLLICAFGYLFKAKKQIIYFISVSIFFTIICVVNCSYYTFYQSFASISLLSTSLQLLDFGEDAAKTIVNYRDFIFIWQPIFIFIMHKILTKRKYYKYVEPIEIGKNRFIATSLASFVTFLLFATMLTSLDMGRLIKQWNREFLVAKFGVYIYQVNDIFRSLEPKINTLFGYDKSIQNVKSYYENRDNDVSLNKYTNIFEGKNVIMIHAESMQQFLIDLEFDGREVTPVLNRLFKEGLSFNNFYSQVSAGTSSDTEFTLSTSILPVSSGTVFNGYFDRRYVTIPNLLKDKGYYTFSMHGNNGTFWNRIVMHERLGYDKFFHKSSYEIDEKIVLGLSDKSFFRQSIPKIKEISENNEKFYATMIMLTNHTPFDEVDKYGEFPVTKKVEIENEFGGKETIDSNYLEGSMIGNYIKSAHYADEAIGEFIQGLDNEGLLENTVVVIYGDHDARLSKKEYKLFYNYDPTTDDILSEDDPNYKDIDYYSYELNRKVPFIIWTKDKQVSGQVDQVMGMYDVLPTLGNMLGIRSEYALGSDIFSKEDNMVVFPNGNWLTNKIYYNSQKQEYLPLIKDAISESYIEENTNKAERIVSVSNDLIVYDYIRHKEETEKLKEVLK